jgi:ribosomal-protein-alanine N-acetyltransferase
MTEQDWDTLLPWSNDPEVMAFADASPFKESTMEDVQQIFRWISTHAFCFMIEVNKEPIGECWLQQMNLKQVTDQFPSKDHRRIDIMIGEKSLWGRGLGTEAIGLLVEFGFASERVEAIFGVVAQNNPRSRRAFEKNGFSLHDVIQDAGDVSHDLMIRRGD